MKRNATPVASMRTRSVNQCQEANGEIRCARNSTKRLNSPKSPIRQKRTPDRQARMLATRQCQAAYDTLDGL